jgi:hypothetical protein
MKRKKKRKGVSVNGLDPSVTHVIGFFSSHPRVFFSYPGAWLPFPSHFKCEWLSLTSTMERINVGFIREVTH